MSSLSFYGHQSLHEGATLRLGIGVLAYELGGEGDTSLQSIVSSDFYVTLFSLHTVPVIFAHVSVVFGCEPLSSGGRLEACCWLCGSPTFSS